MSASNFLACFDETESFEGVAQCSALHESIVDCQRRR